MYTLSKKKRRKKFYVNVEEIINISGFDMKSRKNFSIEGITVNNIRICSFDLAHPLVSKAVKSRFDKLLLLLTELLISDDDSGDTFREALNQIEKFRLIIKNKYRDFLKNKELTEMSNKLKVLRKNAEERLIEINNSHVMSSGKGK